MAIIITKIVITLCCLFVILGVKSQKLEVFFNDLQISSKKWLTIILFIVSQPLFGLYLYENITVFFHLSSINENLYNGEAHFSRIILKRFFESTIIYTVLLVIGQVILHKLGFLNNFMNKKEHVRGAVVVNNLSSILKKSTDKNCISVTKKIRIPFHFETTHFFIIGRPGCGKSQLFYRIINKILERGDKALIYDFKGDQVQKFFNSATDILFNPFDKRCVGWNIFNEISSPIDCRSIATSLVPMNYKSDPYWCNAARDVLASILIAVSQSKKKNNEEFFKWCNLPTKDLMEKLQQYRGTESAFRHLSQEKASVSVLSTMAQHIQCFEYLKEIDGCFSIKKWAGDVNDTRKVYLTNYTEISDSIKPILSLFIEMTGKRVLSLPDDLRRRFFIFVDEFGTLQNMQTIPVMLTNGRSKGLSIWLAIQDVSQIENIYGKETAQTIVNSCSNSFLFSVNDPNTAEYLSRKIGEHEVAVFKKSESSGADNRLFGGSTTKSQDEKNERVFLPSEIMSLPTLSFLFKMSDYPVTPLQLDIVNFPDINQSFEMRDSFGFSVDTSNPEVTESKPVIAAIQKPHGKTLKPFEFDEL